MIRGGRGERRLSIMRIYERATACVEMSIGSQARVPFRRIMRPRRTLRGLDAQLDGGRWLGCRCADPAIHGSPGGLAGEARPVVEELLWIIGPQPIDFMGGDPPSKIASLATPYGW